MKMEYYDIYYEYEDFVRILIKKNINTIAKYEELISYDYKIPQDSEEYYNTCALSIFHFNNVNGYGKR